MERIHFAWGGFILHEVDLLHGVVILHGLVHFAWSGFILHGVDHSA